ncbi:hypothetical protein HYC85_028887 [Camellia sinensis]|uniref:Uncharacterized protein n=1 Tax=Camellia sinensis TaxID=4442 RepID=A0A7J7G0D9_CAMSI|nr:hypothetical protein HYC85_028887 [Camellia sinensis]
MKGKKNDHYRCGFQDSKAVNRSCLNQDRYNLPPLEEFRPQNLRNVKIKKATQSIKENTMLTQA